MHSNLRFFLKTVNFEAEIFNFIVNPKAKPFTFELKFESVPIIHMYINKSQFAHQGSRARLIHPKLQYYIWSKNLQMNFLRQATIKLPTRLCATYCIYS